MKKIIKLLKDLKKINAVAVKQSLEDEGASYEDLIVMRKITRKAKLLLNVREPAKTVDMVPGLQHNLLISASKFADTGYITTLTPDVVPVFNQEDYTPNHQ